MREPSFGRRAAGLGRRLLLLAIGAVVVAVGGITLWAGFKAPAARLAAPIEVVGRATPLAVTIDSGRSGLRTFRVELQGAKGPTVLAQEEFPRDGLLGSGVTSRTIETVLDARTAGLEEGPATLVVSARDWSPMSSLRGESVVLEQPVRVDLTPPSVAVLGTQHYLTRGGSDAVAWTVGEDTVRSGVQIGSYFFPGDAGVLAEANGRFAIYAMPQDLDATVRPKVIAEDGAGNRREVPFPVTVKDKTFPAEEIRVDDQFLTIKIPEIMSQNDLAPGADLVQNYLAVNRDLRRRSEERIQEITHASEPRLLIDGAFRQQPGSKVGSRFAERRTYRYNGDVIDTQVHLGYDLASVKQAPVNASNAGKVAYAGNLGIYGNAVVIDHGLGLSSLYAHLSSASVAQGQDVTKGQEIGRTGETGLAGGDHLHFSILLRGHHIDPVEWWDPKWLQNRILSQISAPAPTPAPTAAPGPSPAAGGAATAARGG